MANSLPLQLAETIQTASFEREPSATRDFNPCSAASKVEPVVAVVACHDDDEDEDDVGGASNPVQEEEEEVDDDRRGLRFRNLSSGGGEGGADGGKKVATGREGGGGTAAGGGVERYRCRYSTVPMPDLRFEQSYLRSLEGVPGEGRGDGKGDRKGEKKIWKVWVLVGWITVRDQVLMPLAQGFVYNLAIAGWQLYNRNAWLHGNGVGARVRRWWYGVNKWEMPPPSSPSPFNNNSNRSFDLSSFGAIKERGMKIIWGG